MKTRKLNVHVHELGRIREADLEIRPLTVFVGPNNTNKTWVACAIYGLVQSLSAVRHTFRSRSAAEPDPDYLIPDSISGAVKAITDRTVQELLEAPEGKISVINVLRQQVLEAVTDPGPYRFAIGPASLAKLLALPQEQFESSLVSLTLDREEFVECGLIGRLEIRMDKQQGDRLFIEPENCRDTYHYSMNTQAGGRFGSQPFFRWVGAYVRWLTLALFEGAVTFPAERKGYLSAYKMLATRREDWEAALGIPARDFLDLLATADSSGGRPNGRNRQFAKTLERELLGGTIQFVQEGPGGEFSYRVEGGPGIRIQSAASFVRSLAGLHAYFNHSTNDVDLIIIDEPEMNLHPEAQMKLVEFLAMLISRGFSVLLTTHSPYVLDHLGNLMELTKLPPSESAKIPFKTRLRHGVSPDDVAAYLFNENGTVDDIMDRREDVINLATFSAESDYVSNLYSKILELRTPS